MVIATGLLDNTLHLLHQAMVEHRHKGQEVLQGSQDCLCWTDYWRALDSRMNCAIDGATKFGRLIQE